MVDKIKITQQKVLTAENVRTRCVIHLMPRVFAFAEWDWYAISLVQLI